MIIKHTSSPVITSGDMEVSKVEIDPNNADFIGLILRDKIYTDKILAPIREYITNAVDAHVESGVDKAVDVRITRNDSHEYIWSVRDYGTGLNEQDVRSIFFSYGSSTKRNSNSQMGLYGIGSKSFACYSESFNVISHFDGIRTHYCCVVGAGNQGVSVSNVYKVSEEPTTETGIEISADISKDYWKFHDKTQKFVENFLPNTKIQYTDFDGNVHVPKTPTLTYEKNGFVVNSYDSMYAGTYLSIRMGGVIYKTDHRVSVYNTFKHGLIVDVPIGRLTIPPSRESLDVSTNNDRVLKEIDAIIQEIYENDKQSLVVPKFGEYISDVRTSSQYEGVWCRYGLRDVFIDTSRFASSVHQKHKMYDEPIKPNANGKYIIYTFPEIRTYRSWVKRLEAVLTVDPDYSGYLSVFETSTVMTNYSKNTDTLDVSDCIFVDVKSLGLPKLVTTPKDKDDGPKEYVIYKDGDKDYATIDGHDENTDAKIYKDADWFKSEKLTRNQFMNRCIGWTNSNDDHVGHGQNNRFWTTGAKKMYDGLVELGFIEVGSQIYKDTLSLIAAREQKQNDIDQAQSRIKNVTFKIGVLPQVANAVGKNPSKLDRLKAMKTKIMAEDSPRKRILEQIENTYSYRSNLTRSDLRMILKMK